MHRLLQVVVLGFALMVAGPVGALEMHPEEYIEFSALSRRIVLVDVESVKISTIESKGGGEIREVVVVGKRVETIRGDDNEAEFRDRSEEMAIVDSAKARRFLPEEVIEDIRHGRPHRASLCEKGQRYLVIFHEGVGTIFFHVRKDDDGWRKRILKRSLPKQEAVPKK